MMSRNTPSCATFRDTFRGNMEGQWNTTIGILPSFQYRAVAAVSSCLDSVVFSKGAGASRGASSRAAVAIVPTNWGWDRVVGFAATMSSSPPCDDNSSSTSICAISRG
eukprot:scaffold2515_cov136-Amphora_coffeaeformis.AAC.5